MKDELFNELLESMCEGGAILRGEKAPSRAFDIETLKHKYTKELLDQIPKLPKRQDSTMDQLYDLFLIANKIGCYDAANFIANINIIKYLF